MVLAPANTIAFVMRLSCIGHLLFWKFTELCVNTISNELVPVVCKRGEHVVLAAQSVVVALKSVMEPGITHKGTQTKMIMALVPWYPDALAFKREAGLGAVGHLSI